MTQHGYGSGHVSLPFAGVAIFARSPFCLGWDVTGADRSSIEDIGDAGILSSQKRRLPGVEQAPERPPIAKRHGVTIDIDGFRPSIAPGSGTPSHEGFPDCEVLELLAGLAKRDTVTCIDRVAFAPDDDHGGATASLAAQVLLNVTGRIIHQRRA